MRITAEQVVQIGAGNQFGVDAMVRARHIRVASDGDLVSSATWRSVDAPSRYFGNHFIDHAEAVITIKPDTNLEFDRGAGLRVNAGALSAVGTSNDRVVFTSASGNPDYWRGLGIASASAENALQHVTIENAEEQHSEINPSDAANLHVATSGRVAATDCTIANCGGWGIVIKGAGEEIKTEHPSILPSKATTASPATGSATSAPEA